MSAFCSGSSGSGALTQLIAQGALDVYLSSNASFTFWKVRYNKHTNFALEAIAQPFNTSVQFGTESQITLNRNGDLIYWMYVVCQLPGITACDTSTDASCNGNITSQQFPSCGDACQPCKAADDLVYEQLADDGYSVAGEEDAAYMLQVAKSRWQRKNYGACAALDCCEDSGGDCPGEVCDLQGPWAHWTNDVGHALVKCARIVIGGSTVDTLYSDFLFMWEELTGRSGRKLTEMVGKRYNRVQLICDSRQKRNLWIPLPFWFTQHSGQALPLASLQFHGVQLHVEWEQLNKLIVTSGSNVTVKNCASACCLSASDLQCCLETTYVYLDDVERSRFSTMKFEMLITQHQHFTQQTNSSSNRLNLNFNHPVIEIIWAVRRKCNESCNNWFNYSGVDNRDPIVDVALYLNNQQRFAVRPGSYFRTVQPYQFHSNIPDCFIYVYSFALHPEDPSPSGSCNMSRIDHVEMLVNLQEGMAREQATILVFARNWNVLRFREGLAGLAYADRKSVV